MLKKFFILMNVLELFLNYVLGVLHLNILLRSEILSINNKDLLNDNDFIYHKYTHLYLFTLNHID